MTPEDLLQELEPLTHAARMRRMVAVGREAIEDGSVAVTLDRLQAGDFYERSLALQSCYGSLDGARALHGLQDPSRSIRGLALKLIPRVCDDAQAQDALRATRPHEQRVILRALRHGRRQVPVDAFLHDLVARGDDALPGLLHFGSASVVATLLDEDFQRAGQDEWRNLARCHPEVALSALQKMAETTKRPDPRLTWLANSALPLLAEKVPDGALELVRLIIRHVPVAQLQLQRLAERRPREVADLVLLTNAGSAITFNQVAHHLGTEQLLSLIQRHANTVSGHNVWFRRLTPDQRCAVYTVVQFGWRDAQGCLAPWVVALLPRDLRETEGRRHLALPELTTTPHLRLPYSAFLPWDEALAQVQPAIGDPDPEFRKVALATLASSARFNRDRLAELIDILRARRNEQDPVRAVMMAGLEKIPPGAWRREHLEGLGQILRDTLDATDLSGTTVHPAERLILRILPFHPDWSASWLATLVQERGSLMANDLTGQLSDAQVRHIAPALLPILQAWETREREHDLIAVARSFGKRLRAFDALVDILERVLVKTTTYSISEWASSLIAEHRHYRLASLVPALLQKDASWVTRPIVYTYLNQRRQDLLTPFLGQNTFTGRFSSGKTRFVLPFRDGFQRWLPSQQTIFAQTLTSVTRDAARDTPAKMAAIRQLSRIPSIPPDALVWLARQHNPERAIRDAAVRALSQMDAGQGVPALMECLADDRDRIAIYALHRTLADMPVEKSVALLLSAPRERVTVFKEVVRLLGDMPSETAYRELLGLEAQPLHRDVRVALLRALWSHLERDEVWPILMRAVASPDRAIATIVGRIPTERLSATAQQRFLELLAALLKHPEPLVRLDVLARCYALPVSDLQQVLLPRLVERLASPLIREGAAAARALFRTYMGTDAAFAGQAVAQILPLRRTLQTTVGEIQTAMIWQREFLLPTARAVLSAMFIDPLTVGLRLSLAAVALPWDELSVLLEELAAGTDLHAEALIIAVQAIQNAARRPDAGEIEELERSLASSPDERLRRLGLAALVAQSQPPRGWNDDRRARLQKYRSDPAPLVAAAAQFTFPPGDEA